jgi:calcineurin-like phosphoesterase
VVRELLPELRRELGADFVVANGENAAGGIGITP